MWLRKKNIRGFDDFVLEGVGFIGWFKGKDIVRELWEEVWKEVVVENDVCDYGLLRYWR